MSFNHNSILFQTNVGPILLSVNPYKDVGNPLTLTSTRGIQLSPKLLRVVQEAVRQQSESGYPQAIILSGKKAFFFFYSVHLSFIKQNIF